MPSRSPNGEGSIYQRSDGRWCVAVTLANGKRKYYYRKTKKLALEALRKHHNLIARMGGRDASRQLFRYYLRAYIERNALEVKERTTELKEDFEKKLVPLVGHIPLSDLSPAQCQGAVNVIAKNHGIRSSQLARALLNTVLSEAEKLELIPRNPCKHVTAPKNKRKEMRLWQPVELALFLETAKREKLRLYAYFYLAVATGMRRGELLGLRWSDVSPEAISIQQIVAVVRGKAVITTPKTFKGKRTIAISPTVYEALMEHQRLQVIQLGKISEYVFASTTGTYTHPLNINRIHKEVYDKTAPLAAERGLEFPYIKPHNLRHMHVSILIEAGYDPTYIARRVGHASAGFTLNVYSHLFDARKREAPMDVDEWIDSNTDSSSLRNMTETDG